MTSPTIPSIVLRIAGVPVPKGRPRFTRQGRTYTPAATKKWEEHVRDTARRCCPDVVLDGPLRCGLKFWLPVPKSWSKSRQERALEGTIAPTSRPDIENLAKSILDAFNGLLYHDDSQVVDLRLVKRYGAVPGVGVWLEQVEEADESV